MKQMQGLDAAFVAMESPAGPAHIGSILIYDPSTAPNGFVRFKDILNFISGRLHLADTMRQKMVKVPFGIDYPYWVNDSSFDLEFHVRHVALPSPGDWRQLCIQAARIFARPLDLSRPPWEVTVIEGLDNVAGVPKGSYAMVTKVHHSAIDGVSGVDIMNALHTITAAGNEPIAIDEWRPEADPSQIGMFIRGISRSMQTPMRTLSAMQKSMPGMLRVTKGLLSKKYNVKAMLQTPQTRFNGTVSPHRMVDARSFAMSDIKKIRTLAPGSTLNDVMLSIVGGTMRNYLQAKDELPETSMTAMAPISVRDDSEKNSMGNQVAAMHVPLGSHIASPATRLRYVYEESTTAKSMTEALGARQMSELSKLSPAPVMNIGMMMYRRLKLANYMKPIINTVVTNVPGPPIPIYSAGAKLIGLYGMLCLMDGLRIGHIVHSYVDQITLTFTADRNAVPDPDFYAECMQKSFDEHMQALKKAPKKAKDTSENKEPAKRKTIKKTISKKLKAKGKKSSITISIEPGEKTTKKRRRRTKKPIKSN